MTSENRYKTVLKIAEYLPEPIFLIISELPQKIQNEITEIRLRAGRPLALTVNGENVFISQKGQVCYLNQHGLYIVSAKEVELTFQNMCEHSVYAYTEQIKRGYIALPFGCRAGLAASAVYENGTVSGFAAVSSVNIRIASEYIGCSSKIRQYLIGGVLVFGPPSSGKTTLLRDIIRSVSYGEGTIRRRVAVIDSRGELAALYGSVPYNDVGPLTDVINCTDRSVGVEIALRTLNPEVIAFDELGSTSEVNAVEKCFHSGADIITTVHAGDVFDLKNRECAKKLLSFGAVKYAVHLKSVGETPSVFKVEQNEGEFELVPIFKETVLC